MRNTARSVARRTALALIGAALLSANPAKGSVRPSVSALILTANTPLVIAHRGCAQSAPENSLAALEVCIQLGVDLVEGDVRATRDGTLILLHDPTLDRTTDTSGALEDFDEDRLRAVRLRAGAGGRNAFLTAQSVPRLSEFLERARGHMRLLLHVKVPRYAQIYEEVKKAHAESDVALLIEADRADPTLLHAPFWGHLAYVPVISVCDQSRASGCYGASTLRVAFSDYRPMNPVACLPAADNNDFLNQSGVAVKSREVPVIASFEAESVRSAREAGWKDLVTRGVALIITNNAPDLVAFLKQQGLR